MNNRKAALVFLVRIAPHLMKQSFSLLYSMNKNILIVFRNYCCPVKLKRA